VTTRSAGCGFFFCIFLIRCSGLKKGHTMTGEFIVVDGPDGAGKSTIVARAVEQLQSEGFQVLATREPGGSPFAEMIRGVLLDELAGSADPLTMLNLFSAARLNHLQHTIVPALLRGTSVICDRFDMVTWAYQVIADGNSALVEVFDLLRTRWLEHVKPFYVLLDVSPEVGRARLVGRHEKLNHFDTRPLDWHTRARQGYHGFLCRYAGDYAVIDTDAMTKEEVEQQLLAIVRPLLQAA